MRGNDDRLSARDDENHVFYGCRNVTLISQQTVIYFRKIASEPNDASATESFCEV